MGTRAAAFAGKILNLRESISRIQNNTMPQPTCFDLSNIMKYFCQILHEFRDFKDIENIPLYASEKRDQLELIKTLPNFDYCGLYKTLSLFVDILPLIQNSNGLDQLGENLLMLFKCLVPFLDQFNMETMPYLITSLFMSLPQTLHKDILDTLCFNLLPFTIDQQHKNTAKMMKRIKLKKRISKLKLAREDSSAEAPGIRKKSSLTTQQQPIDQQAKKKRPAHCIVRIENLDEPTGASARRGQAGGEKIKQASPDSNNSSSEGPRFHANRSHLESAVEATTIERAPEEVFGNDGCADPEGPEQETCVDELDGEEEEEEFALLSVTSILMIAFHYISEPMHHSQLVECLMKLKNNVFEDLLFVIAYGTTRARCPAVELLFKYWPDINPNQQDKKNLHQVSSFQAGNNKLKHVSWLPTKCQNKQCNNFTTLGDDEAVKMCLDFKISIALSGLPPPMLICLDCVDSIYKQQMISGGNNNNTSTQLDVRKNFNSITDDAPTTTTSENSNSFLPFVNSMKDDYNNKFLDLLLPMDRISKLCENKKCKSSEKQAIGTCFDIECANYNSKKPIRYCKQCFITIHEPCEANNYDVTLENHIRHSSLKLTIMESGESVNNFVEAIISLLKEAAPAEKPSKDGSERYLRSLMGPMSQFQNDNKDMMNIATEEKQLISRYGIWLMTGLCKSVDQLNDELLGRLLGMLFQWFHFTACLPDDQAGSALEKLKGECIKGWIMGVKEKRLDVFISCLLPHPIDCSKIGGHWEVWPDTAYQIKEGFKRLLCLVPYDIITDDVWDEIMPYWMDCFRYEVPENELNELKILLSKVFDPELSPLGFETNQMYNFISSRFKDSDNLNQEQTLYWLQIITMLEIPIPIDFLYQMLKAGVKSLATIRANELNRIKQQQQQQQQREQVSSPAQNNSESDAQRQAGSIPSNSSSNNSSSASSPTPESSIGVSDTFAPTEDDVMLPEKAGAEFQLDRAAQLRRQQEKQMQARAAFSARIIQQASILDAQVGIRQQANSSIGSASSIMSSMATPSGLPESIASTTALSPIRDSSLSSGLPTQMEAGAGEKARNLSKSTSSSAGPEASLKKKRAHKQGEKRGNNRSQEKPKLKLQLASASNSPVAMEEYLNANKIDNNLVCYILMMDILLKQLDLQEINSHRGLDGKEAQQAIELLNAIISTPWIGRHTCCESLSQFGQQQQPLKSPGANQQLFYKSPGEPLKRSESPSAAPTSANVHSFAHCVSGFEQTEDAASFETCVFCEIISTFHQLAMYLIEFFSPVIEVSICEVSHEATNGEFDGKPDYSRIGMDHLDESPSPAPASGAGDKFNFKHAHSIQQQQQQQNYQLDPSSPFSPSYFGPFLKPDVLSALPNELQLSYNLLVQFHQYQSPDIVSQLLQMIKLVSLHSQVLSRASKNNPQFITWCQHNMLVHKLWSLCQLESSEIARTCVPLLLHCITLPWGVRLFRDLIEKDFNSENWLSRFKAVERVITIAYFCEPSTIKNSTLLQSTMASAFCFVVRCLDDIEAVVAQRALVSLEMMKTSSLKLLLWCLEVQFDFIIIDRPMILRSVFQLYNHLKDRKFLTWEFFLNRFDTIFLEAQIYLQQTGEIPSFTMQDLKNTNTKSEIYQKKIQRAKEALQETHHSRSLSIRLRKSNAQAESLKKQEETDCLNRSQRSIKLQRHMQSCDSGTGSVFLEPIEAANNETGAKRRILPNLSPHKRVLQHGRSTSSRYQSVAFITSQSMVKRKNSKFMSNLALQSVPPLLANLPDKLHQHLPNSFIDGDGSKLNEIAQENHVFGVVHRICDEDRDTNHSLVSLLMQFFSKPDPSHPQSIKTLNRSHQIVLRHLNILMGYSIARKNFLISAANLRLLPVFNAFLTSLPKVLDFNYSLGTILLDTCLPILIYCPTPDELQFDSVKSPTYSLWLLNPLMRQSWLMSVMTFLYKYQFNQAHLKDQVCMLMWIVINTLESHLKCTTAETHPVLQQPAAASLSNQRGDSATILVSSEPELQRAEIHNHSKAQQDLHAPQATSSGVDSPARASASQLGPQSAPSHKLDMIEMQTKREAGKIVAQSTSTNSLGIQQSGNGAIEPTLTQAGGKILVKADTSDNLNVKSGKLFQSRGEFNKVPGTIRTGLASKQIEQLPGEPAKQMNSSDERLLPIGLHSVRQSALRTALDAPATERLLPIGASGSTRGPNESEQNLAIMLEEPERQGAQQAEQEAALVSAKSGTKEVQNQQPRGQNLDSPLEPALGSSSAKGTKSKRGFTSLTGKQLTNSSDAVGSSKQPSGGGISDNADSAKPQQNQAAPAAATTTVATGISIGGNKKNKFNKLTKEYVPPKPLTVGSIPPSFSSPSLLNEQLALINRHSSVQEFSDKDLSMCLVILETFIHHEPSMAAQMLPNILRLVARYSSASLDSSQSGSNVHLVGGSMFVARQFIRVALHDLMENNIFHQIFTSHFTGYEFYKSMATALADFPDLNQLAPLSKLFEDLNRQKNLPQASSLMTILENVATYFECIIAESTNHSQTTWTNFINNWENFLRKLILALPRYSGSTITTTTSGGRSDGTSSMAHSNHHHHFQGSSSTGASNVNQFLTKSSGNMTINLQQQAASANPGAIIATVGPGGNQAANTVINIPAGAVSSVSPSANPCAIGATNSSELNHHQQQQVNNLQSANSIPSSCSMIMRPIMRIILSTSKISHLASCKTIVDPYSKIISYTVLHSQFKYEHLLEINHNCCRLYARDREKYLIQRTIAYELVQVLKFRFFILEENLLILLLFILQDVGGTLAPKVLRENLKINQSTLNQADNFITNISECLRNYIGELLEFVTDVHAISRINDNLGSQPPSINRDSFGGHVKAAISQYLALEMSLANGADNRTVLRYMPWLYQSPSLQQGPREFIDCVSHIRQLSWIILGSLQHSTIMKSNFNSSLSPNSNSLQAGQQQHDQIQSSSHNSNIINCQPIPIGKNGNVAEHIQVILAGFADQSKESVLHMSGLFHAFLLCQLWTMYCENISSQHPANSEQYQFCQSTLDDFWNKITPGILRLVGHSRVMSEMVSTHFLNLIESLIESNSSILIRYLPMWNSVFYSYKKRNKSGNLAIRLQKCIEWQPPDLNEENVEQNNKRLICWLEKVEYKMSHIEIQSSQATPFYLT